MKKKGRKTGFIVMCAMAIALFVDCSHKKDSTPVSNIIVKTPYQEIDSTIMSNYSGSKKTFSLESNHIVKSLADTGHILAWPVKILLYDSLGALTSRIISDSGSSDAAMRVLTAWSNVFVKAKNGVRVKAQLLHWDQNTHRVTSDTYVEILTRKGDVLRGKGLDAAEDFSSWEFKHDVSGRFPNFKERVDKGDDF
jgi:LPS export ABC transporter protein LptC